eukprot:TRINITY_DN599_c0_g1_i2.p1 TRINITY_DN599_c0_g1~~TRINITY_DN599_c0_g1_i2.p1  ORF type:complete len:202 (+),score=91.23 TRINITY_DN599_c0_g1_i2:145-750(+)
MAFSMMVRRMSAVGVKASGSPKKVAVIMSGSGFQDGSEIHETVAVLFHISNNEATYDCFAPDAPQSEVVNHLSGTSSSSETRNVLTESARIARGKIEPLSKLSAQNYDALFVPGGYGAAKNLSDFYSKGSKLRLETDVNRVLQEFKTQSKPIGLCCISGVLAAKAFPRCKVTIGGPEQAGTITSIGGKFKEVTLILPFFSS